jgi:hypothetical protein
VTGDVPEVEVEVALDEAVTVRMREGDSSPYEYAVVHDGEVVASYESGSHPQTPGARVAIRNLVCRWVPDREKDAVEEALVAGLEANEAAVTDAFGTV